VSRLIEFFRRVDQTVGDAPVSLLVLSAFLCGTGVMLAIVIFTRL
jgi:hypothetical protein